MNQGAAAAPFCSSTLFRGLTLANLGGKVDDVALGYKPLHG
jgi:hypothetical protein